MENYAINFFLNNKDSLAEFIGKIKVNREKTSVKYGFHRGKSLSITFITYGQLDETITSYEEKIKCILNSKDDLTDLNDFLGSIKLSYTFIFSPFLNITKGDGVITHAFNITAKFIKDIK